MGDSIAKAAILGGLGDRTRLHVRGSFHYSVTSVPGIGTHVRYWIDRHHHKRRICMTDHFRLVAILGLLLMIVTGGLVAQTTYELPTGKTLTVINQLPETLGSYFDKDDLFNRLGRQEPAFDIRVGASVSGRTLNLVVMIPDFYPETPVKDLFGHEFQPNAQRLLPTGVPQTYMFALLDWYAGASRRMPEDLRAALREYRLSYYAIFQKGDHWLMFTGERGSNGLPKVIQPITSTDADYGEVQIWGDRSGYFSTVQRALDQNFYPLDPSVDRVTGERNTSWLVYRFFDALPEEE
jgi:hypothetical protein